MSKKERTKKQYPENFRGKMGFALPGFSIAFASVVYGLFLQYLTDYSGIDNAIGIAGFAATFGTGFLVFTRIVDAIDDPLQAFIMDNAKERKFGKYRWFTMISAILIFVGLVMMFGIPDSLKSAAIPLAIWFGVGYIIYEMGYAFHAVMPVLQKVTKDANVRAKIMIFYRLALVLGAIPAVFFVPIATVVNQGMNNMGKAVSLTCIVIVGISTLISLIGVALLKEPYVEEQAQVEEKQKVKISDVIELFKKNKAMWVHDVAYTIGNMAYGLSSVMMVYFLKWQYCANYETGAVDNVQYAGIYSMATAISVPLQLLAPIIVGWIIKKVGAIDKTARGCMLIAGIMYSLIFVCHVTGVLVATPYAYIALNSIAQIFTSLATVPFLLLNVEVADYTEYQTGKNMTALISSVMNIFSKSSTALSTAITGGILIIANYSVDSVTGAYAGNVADIPGMVTNFTLFVGLVPAICCLVCWLMYKCLYPITPEVRATMVEKLAETRNS